MKATLIELHRASQYLACAGKSFIDHKEDDSHTALYWDVESNTLFTQALSKEGLRLGLNHDYFTLDFTHPRSGVEASFPLSTALHFDVVNWIERERSFCGVDKPYQFDLHYDLQPPVTFDDHFRFGEIDKTKMQFVADARSFGGRVLDDLRKDYQGFSEVRIWPHHFDTGASLEIGSITFSLGLAMLDSMLNGLYFYISAFKGDEAMNTDGYPQLAQGEWKSGDWKGAVLNYDEEVEETTVKTFLKESINLVIKQENA